MSGELFKSRQFRGQVILSRSVTSFPFTCKRAITSVPIDEVPKTKIVGSVSVGFCKAICLHWTVVSFRAYPDRIFLGAMTGPELEPIRVLRDHNSRYPDSQRTARMSSWDERLPCIGVFILTKSEVDGGEASAS